jgi:predicted nucleotidyltransferase
MKDKNNNEIILKVLVGSRAHGLHTENSDFDYRGVFVLPTERLFQLGSKIDQTSWIEPPKDTPGKIDDTTWEIQKFLLLATKCNPTILETFFSPPIYKNEWGTRLIELFPHVWNSEDVKNAFIGYGLNQRKKFFENQDNRAPKYATAYLRTLYNAWELLSTGTFHLDMTDTPVFEQLKRFKAGDYTIGEVIQSCYEWQTKVELAYKKNPNKMTDLEPVNQFLLDIRKYYLNEGN